jgi:hypothetical protein
MIDAEEWEPESSPRRAAVVVAALILGSLVWQSTFPFLLGIDTFYHLAQARAIVEHGLDPGMPWMAFSIFEDGWVDHHFGFHLTLIPFVLWPGGVLGGKLAAGVFGGLAVAAAYLWLRAERVPHPALFALLPVAASWGFAYRIGMVRAMPLSVILLFAALYAATRGRNVLLFAVSAVYALSYHLAILVIPIAVGAVLARRVFGTDEPARGGPTPWTPVAAAAGVAAGFTIHPNFPGTWEFFARHVLLGVNLEKMPQGIEWLPASVQDFWMQGFALVLLLVLVLVPLLRLARPGGGLKSTTWLLLVGASCGVVLMVRSVRFVELGMPLTGAALGLLARDSGLFRGRISRRGLVVAWTTVLLVLGLTLGRAQRNGDTDPYRFEPAAQWLRANVPPGTLIYNFHWSEWPELVFHAPDYTYIFGLTPSFLAEHDPEKWRHFWAIRRGEYGNASDAIRNEFGAEWVLLGLPDPASVQMLDEDAGLERAVRTADFAIYRVLPAP